MNVEIFSIVLAACTVSVKGISLQELAAHIGTKCPEEVKAGCSNNIFTYCLSGEVVINVKCSEVVGKPTGFCDCENKMCVERAPAFCPRCNESLKGKLVPNPNNCKQFLYCEQSTGSAVVMECPEVYDPIRKQCVGRSEYACRTASCPSKGFKLVPLTGAPAYYLICYNGESNLLACDVEGYGLNATSGECEYNCVQSGYFQATDSEECEKGGYVSCTKSLFTFKKQEFRCPQGLVFDNDVLRCVVRQDGICPKPEETSNLQLNQQLQLLWPVTDQPNL